MESSSSTIYVLQQNVAGNKYIQERHVNPLLYEQDEHIDSRLNPAVPELFVHWYPLGLFIGSHVPLTFFHVFRRYAELYLLHNFVFLRHLTVYIPFLT